MILYMPPTESEAHAIRVTRVVVVVRAIRVGMRVDNFIDDLEQLRQLYLMYKDTDKKLAKKYWKELIRWLPESWLQMRTVTMTYENVFAMTHQREHHKQNEWSGKDNPMLQNFIQWAHTLPLADRLIFVKRPTPERHAKIVCISGKARAGKDTSAQFLKEHLEWNLKSNTLIIHNADLLKYMCTSLLGWDGIKDEKGRHMLQYVGTDVVRKKDPNFWVNYILKILELFPDQWDYVLIPDVRFPNEIEVLKNAGFDVKHIHINRHVDNGLTDEQKAHASETALDELVPDAVIENDGTLADLKCNIVGAFERCFNIND